MPYTTTPTSIPDVLILQPRVLGDERGFFFESFNAREFERATGLRRDFVQDNHSRSRRGVLRGLHYQQPHPQGKLVRVTQGEVFDVAVDLRRDSPTFARSVAVTLSAENTLQLWIPEGFAHGFLVTSAWADVVYKTTDFHHPEAEHTLLWNDPVIGIDWPLGGEAPLLAARDAAGTRLADAPSFQAQGKVSG